MNGMGEEAVKVFNYTGGAVRLVEAIEDSHVLFRAWGHHEKDAYTLPFGPWAFTPEHEDDPLAAGPWVWRYGTASAATGSKYEALATRVHADVASRLGGPVVVALLSPVRSCYTFSDEGYLDETYVSDKLRLTHPDDTTAATMLVRILLGRTDALARAAAVPVTSE